MAKAIRKMAVYLGLVEDDHRYQDLYAPMRTGTLPMETARTAMSSRICGFMRRRDLRHPRTNPQMRRRMNGNRSKIYSNGLRPSRTDCCQPGVSRGRGEAPPRAPESGNVEGSVRIAERGFFNQS